jgi:hypothetical protein
MSYPLPSKIIQKQQAFHNPNPIFCTNCNRSEIEMKAAYKLGAPRYCPCGKIFHRCSIHPFMQIEGDVENDNSKCSCKTGVNF